MAALGRRRAVFVLREVFALTHDDIAQAIGKRPAAVRQIAHRVREHVAAVEAAQVNGYPALIVRFNGEVDTVVVLRVEEGLITGLYAVRNPEKLSRLEQATSLPR